MPRGTPPVMGPSGRRSLLLGGLAAAGLALLPRQVSGAAAFLVGRDLAYGGDPLQRLDIYAPEGAQGLPVIVWIHGGGWRRGDKNNNEGGPDKAARLCPRGYLLVAINYRLSPVVLHPTHVEDCAAAIAWIHAEIAAYGGDLQRIVLLGHSAGAHLAALIASDERRLRAHNLELSTISAAVLLDGAGYDIPARMAEAGSVERNMFLRAFGDDPAVWRDASPLFHVAAGKGIPPFQIFHVARRTDSRQQSEALGAALAAAGVPAEVVPVPGTTHGSINSGLGRDGDPVTAPFLAFLARYL